MKPVFIHISKNAGTSIIDSVADHIVSAGHRTASSWIEEHGRDAPLFAVVRNPFDRVVSEYSFRKRRYDAGEQDNTHLSNLSSFEEWAVGTFRDGQFRTREFFERYGASFHEPNMIDGNLIWFIPQTRWLGDAKGTLLVDDVLRFEHLAEDWPRFCEKHGIPVKLERLNTSPRRRDYRSYYSDTTRDLIAAYYGDDLERFDYSF